MSKQSTFQRLLENYRRDHQHPMNRATHMVGIPMIVASLPAFFFDFKWGLGLFVVGWIFQFVGHAFEGNMPSFVRDPRFLLVGPIFIVKKYSEVFRRSAKVAEN